MKQSINNNPNHLFFWHYVFLLCMLASISSYRMKKQFLPTSKIKTGFFGHPTFNKVSKSKLIGEFFTDFTSTVSYLEVQWKHQHGEEEMNGGSSQFCLGY